MQTFNFFENQLVDVNDLMTLQSVPQSAIKDILVSLSNKGVITGVSVTPTSPTPSKAVVVTSGKMILEDGSDITTGTSTQVDLSSNIAALTLGQSVWLTIYAVPTQISDTPVVTPAGTTINYRTYDSVVFVVVTGTPSTGTPVKSNATPSGYTGVLIADVLVSYGLTAILIPNIDQTRMNSFVNIPYLLDLTNRNPPPWPISYVTGLQNALDNKMPLTYAIPESQVTGLQGDLNTLTTNLANLNTALITYESTTNTTLVSHGSSITNLNNGLASTNSTVFSHTTSINNLNSQMSTANTNIAAIFAWTAEQTADFLGNGHVDIACQSGLRIRIVWGSVNTGTNFANVSFEAAFSAVYSIQFTNYTTRAASYINSYSTIGCQFGTDGSTMDGFYLVIGKA
jgi:hypothetical protein